MSDLATARTCLLGCRERLATFRRLGMLNSNDRALHDEAVQCFYHALDLVWFMQQEAEKPEPPRSLGRIIYGPEGSGWWEYAA
jgi:hypothetical protein